MSTDNGSEEVPVCDNCGEEVDYEGGPCWACYESEWPLSSSESDDSENSLDKLEE